MRRRISLLVAATTSAVILAFLIPLGLLVRTLAENRAVASASQEAQGVATLVAGVNDERQLRNLVSLVDRRSARATSILLPDGRLIGTVPPHSSATDPAVIPRARAGAAFTLVSGDGAQVVVPVVTERGTVVVRTAVSADDLHQGVVTAWATFAGLGAVLMAAAVLGADRLGRRVSAPVTELAAVAHRLRAGELDARAVPRGPAETVELGAALNRLADRIGELLTAEREAVADLSHRLRTPITALRLDAGAVAEPELAARLSDHIGHLQRAVDAIVKDARRPVRSTLGRSCDASSVVRDRVTFWSALAVDQGRELTVSIPVSAVPVAMDAADLVDVVDALVDNVFAHTPDGTAFAVTLTGSDSGLRDEAVRSITAARGEAPRGEGSTRAPAVRGEGVRGEGVGGMPGLVRLEVADSGPGAADSEVATRGHSTADSSGLGLDIVRRAAIAAGGDLIVDTSPSGGMLAVVTLGVARS